MPRTAVTVNTLGSAGTAPPSAVACDVTNGNVANSLHKNMWFEIRNTHATLARTITFVTPGTAGGFAIADNVVSIPALTTREFGGFDVNIYGSGMQFDGQTTDVTYIVRQIV